MNILITGAKGFVGKNLCAQLKNIRDGKARNYGVEVAEVFEYDLDSTPIPVELTEHGKTVEISVKNTPSRGSLKLIKKDAYENKPLAGATYRLMDESGKKLAEGTADENGEIVNSYSYIYENGQITKADQPKDHTPF